MNLAGSLRLADFNLGDISKEIIGYFYNRLAESYSIRLEKSGVVTGRYCEEEGNGQDCFHGWG